MVYVGNTPLEIMLNGESEITFIKGEEYIEQGAEVTDNLVPDIKSKLTINSMNLDLDKVGTYGVYYSATDHAGNATCVERTVTVIPAPSPSPEPSISPSIEPSAEPSTTPMSEWVIENYDGSVVNLKAGTNSAEDGTKLTLLIAKYSDIGIMTDCEIIFFTVEQGKDRYTIYANRHITKTESTEVKLMLWNDKLRPMALPYS